MRGSFTKVKDDLYLLRVSQACQSTLHLKSDLNMSRGQFLVTKVTAGQQMEQPKRRRDRFMNLDFRLGLRRMGVRRRRLIRRLVLE